MVALLAIALLSQAKLKSIFSPLPVNADPNAHAVPLPETKAEKDKRMAWWTDAKFGLFIHWGTYAVPAGTWDGKTNYAEWIREEAQIPIKTYDKFATEFDPTQFDADAWVKMAKEAGMKYIVITSKHHEGFNMFASEYSKYNIMNTPWHHDPMKDLAKACKKYGLKFCFYYSIMDWHRDDYLPRRSWEVNDRPAGNANFSHYADYLFHEIDQLLTQYGPIGVLWFDGEWESTWKEPYGTELYNLCRTLQPNIIVNNRVGHARDFSLGDYSTPEQTIPPTGIPGQFWETCMTMNDHWGYNSHDKDFKSTKTLLRNLVDIVSKGGNYLLNIGPTARGTFPPESIERLKEIGAWMNVNNGAIYNTTHSLYSNLTWGRNTNKFGPKTTKMYFEVFDWPKDGKLVIPSTNAHILQVKLLGSDEKIHSQKDGTNIVIPVPETEPDSVCPVVEVDVLGKPVVYSTPVIASVTPSFVTSTSVTITGSEGTEVHYTTDGSDPVATSPVYSIPLTFDSSQTVKAAEFDNGQIVSDIASLDVEKVEPLPPLVGAGGEPGLQVDQSAGPFEKVADVLAAQTTTSVVETKVELDPSWGSKIPEHVGRVFTGDIEVPTTDVYRFKLTSDDGSALFIDGRLTVNNDGLHSSLAKEGNAALAAGMHSIKLVYFNATGDAALKLEWATRDGAFTEVPSSAYHHGPAGLPPGTGQK